MCSVILKYDVVKRSRFLQLPMRAVDRIFPRSVSLINGCKKEDVRSVERLSGVFETPSSNDEFQFQSCCYNSTLLFHLRAISSFFLPHRRGKRLRIEREESFRHLSKSVSKLVGIKKREGVVRSARDEISFSRIHSRSFW